MREVAVIGVGLHPWGIFDDKPLIDMAVQATNEALKDAGLKFSDIQGMCAGESLFVPLLGGNCFIGNVLADILGKTGMDINYIGAGCAGSVMVYHTAFLEIASGRKDIVLAVGADKNPRGQLNLRFPESRADYSIDQMYIQQKAIGVGNPALWALMFRRRMLDYGSKEEHLARVAVKSHKNGSLNPYARYKKIYTIEEILASPVVAEPLRVLEMCPFSHGASALIFCSVEKARQLTTHPVIVSTTALGSPEYGAAAIHRLSMTAKPTARHNTPSGAAVWRAYEQAGIGPEDINFVELGDACVLNELEKMEDFGFCKPGEAEKMVERGETEINGKLPINTSGGSQSFGEATIAQGLMQMVELVWQLRGQAGQRQVPNHKVGLCEIEGAGPNGGAAILKI